MHSRTAMALRREFLRRSLWNTLPRIRPLSTISQSSKSHSKSDSIRPLSSASFAAIRNERKVQAPSVTFGVKSELERVLADMNEDVDEFKNDPIQIVRWAVEHFEGRVAMSTSFGIQSAVLLHLATQVMPKIPIIWVDTGYLPKETYEYAQQLTELLDLNLIVKSNEQWTPARMEAIHGKLWEREDVEAHTLYGRLRKVEPLVSGLKSLNPNPLALFSGLRASQTAARANMNLVGYQNERFKILPLLKMTDDDVAKYMDMYDLPAHPLASKGYVTVGDWHSSRPVEEGENARNTRFGGKFEECGLHVDVHEPVKGENQKADEPAVDNIHVLDSFKKTGVDALETVSAHSETEVAVIMVKKVMEDGSYCRKCNDVSEKLVADGVADWIGSHVLAEVNDPLSAGSRLAKHFGVATAPFFLVRTAEEQQAGSEWKVIRSYLQLRKFLETSHEKVLERRSQKPQMPLDNKEFIQAQHHLKELQLHAERLQKELAQSQAKLQDTKRFFVNKFKDQFPDVEQQL